MRNRISALLAALALTLFLAACGGDSAPPPPPPPVTISVSPSSATVPAQGTQQFTAIVGNTSNHSVTWQVNGVTGGNNTIGTIDASGFYTAPNLVPSPASVTIAAISEADSSKSDTASVTVVIGVTVSPLASELLVAGVQQFTATVTGSVNTAVTWSVSCSSPGCDPSTLGTIDGTGLYTAPNAIPDNVLTDQSAELQQLQPAASPIAITATSQADPNQSASAAMYVNAGSQSVNQNLQSPPIALGTSGGNVNDITGNFCCSGTLGSLVDRAGTKYVLSNNHVLARRDQAAIGEHITQPGLVDTNCTAATEVATLSQFIKLRTGTHPADAAIAKIVGNTVDTTGKILQFGPVTGGLADPATPVNPPINCNPPDASCTVGLPVAKSGRTSGLSCSKIAALGVSVTVGYETGCNGGTQFNVTYTNQIDIESVSFGAPGDSGSLIVDAATTRPVGLLYAGSDTDTIANPITTVLSNLKDSNNNVPTMVGGAANEVEACTGNIGPAPPKGNAAREILPEKEVQHVLAVKEAHVKELLSIPAVIGVGVGAGDKPGKAAIVIFVEKGKKPGAIPAEVDGVKTRIHETKPFHSFTRIPWCPSTDKGVTDPVSLSGSLHEVGFWDLPAAGYGETRLQSRQHAPCVK
jgi:hypothetical protein